MTDVSGTVDVGGGRRLFIECRGRGSPTVVLVSGQRGSAGDWHVSSSAADPPEPAVSEQLVEVTRVCAYDRPGTPVGEQFSRSDPVPQPTTAAAAAADLAAVLRASGETGPFVLVAHSAGGMVARMYAATHPDDVAGLVLVDALAEFLQDAQTPQQWEIQRRLIAGDIATMQREYPDIEWFDADTSFDQLRAAPALREMPLVVVSADEPIGPALARLVVSGAFPGDVPEDFGDVIDAAQALSQRKQAALVPGSEHLTETHSGHNVHHQQPGIVVDAVRRVVGAVGDGRRTMRGA